MYMRSILKEQLNRAFVYGLLLCQDELSVWLSDRSGVLGTQTPVNIHKVGVQVDILGRYLFHMSRIPSHLFVSLRACRYFRQTVWVTIPQCNFVRSLSLDRPYMYQHSALLSTSKITANLCATHTGQYPCRQRMAQIK